MKKLKQFVIIAIVILAVGCSKNEDNQDGKTGQKILTMKVDGVDWVSDDNTSGYIQKTNNKLFLTGRKVATDETFLISDVSVIETGTFPIVASAGQISFLRDGASPKIYQVRTTYPKSRATLIVTKITSKDNLFYSVEGTFSGALYTSATDSIVITNGIFKSN